MANWVYIHVHLFFCIPNLQLSEREMYYIYLGARSTQAFLVMPFCIHVSNWSSLTLRPVEMFPPEANGAAQGIASFFNWFANTLAAIKINTLYIFLSFQAIIIVYSILFVVETHDKTSQEVIEEYNKICIC
ncbi:hypothetical protein MXB_2802 [Myxobolus squamalis]|nr:hypothetical protein MXB_2802 [Myxobolus squamalis]